MHSANHSIAVCHSLARAISGTRTVDEIHAIALDALTSGLGVSRASILLFDAAGVMRFTAWRGLSDAYRRAVEGHTPWSADTLDPEPIIVPDAAADPSLAPFLPTIQAERIAGMAFVPLVSLGRVIGKFMIYFDEPGELTPAEIQLATLIGSHVAFAVERTRAEAQARRDETRLRYVLDAAEMGTWEWDLARQRVVWSDNLERLHGVAAGAFDHTFASYERVIHPEDHARVAAALRRAIEHDEPLDIEYRVIAQDGR